MDPTPTDDSAEVRRDPSEYFAHVERGELAELAKINVVFATYLALRSFDFDGDGRVHPGIDTLKAILKKHGRTVERALERLQEIGRIKIDKGAVPVQGGRADAYNLIPTVHKRSTKPPRIRGDSKATADPRESHRGSVRKATADPREGETGRVRRRERAAAPYLGSPDDPEAVRAVLLGWEWTPERIEAALRGTMYRFYEVVADVPRKGNPLRVYDNRANRGAKASEFKELVLAVARAQKALRKRQDGQQQQPEQQQGYVDVRDEEPLRRARTLAELAILLDERLRRIPAPDKWTAFQVGVEFSYGDPPPPTADDVRNQLRTDQRFAVMALDVEGMSDQELLALIEPPPLIERPAA